MLRESNVYATIPVRDQDVAKKFYGDTLGLKLDQDMGDAGALYKSGESFLFVYPSQFAGTNQGTAATWVVDDVESCIEALKGKGIAFEHYDNLPGTTVEGDVHIMGNLKSAWFKDPTGNILNINNGAM